ncbi:MAG: hypothetical protein AB7Y46_06615 [Armatimonadota bacterium]
MRSSPRPAPWLEGADLLISADCVPHALGGFRGELPARRQVITACPTLDDMGPCLSKLAEICRRHGLRRMTAARMEIPCCAGLVALVRQAIEASGRSIPLAELVVSIAGGQLSRTEA